MVTNIFSVRKIELLWAEASAVFKGLVGWIPLLVQVLKVLACKGDLIFWLGSNNFLDEVFEDAGKSVWDFNLLGSENALIVDVGHNKIFNKPM